MSTETEKNTARPDSLQGSINELKSQVQFALDNAKQYALQQSLVQQQITEIANEKDNTIAQITAEKEAAVQQLEAQLAEALEAREQMQARLERIVSRLRLMGLEQSHYE